MKLETLDEQGNVTTSQDYKLTDSDRGLIATPIDQDKPMYKHRYRIYLNAYRSIIIGEAEDIDEAVNLAKDQAKQEPTDWQFEDDFDLLEATEETEP